MAKRNNENTVKTDLFKISPNDIVVTEGFNSRVDFDLDGLVESVKENGVLNPISVVPFVDENGQEKYRLIDGERRYRAVLEANKQGAEILRIPTIFLSKNLTETDALIQQIIRNEGKNFNEYEYGVAYKKLIDKGWTNVEIAKKLGCPEWRISLMLAHLRRDERVQNLMKTGKIEGMTVRRIYQAHKGDEKGAVAEILKAQGELGKTDTKGKTVEKITLDTLKNLEGKSKTIAKKDSERILAGLKTLYQYVNAYREKGIENVIDLNEVIAELKEGKLITEIFDEAIAKSRAE